MFGPSFQTIIDGVFRQLPKWYFHWSFQYDSVTSIHFHQKTPVISHELLRLFLVKGQGLIFAKVSALLRWNAMYLLFTPEIKFMVSQKIIHETSQEFLDEIFQS